MARSTHLSRAEEYARACAYVNQPSATTQASLLETATLLFTIVVGSLGFFMMYAANAIPLTARPAVL